MNLIRNINVLALLLFSTACPYQHGVKKKIAYKNQAMVISIPKCGTHLLLKYLNMLELDGIRYNVTADGGKRSAQYYKKIRKLNQFGPPNHYKGMFYLPKVGPIPKKLVARMKRATTKKRGFWFHWPHTKQFARFLDRQTYANFLIIRDPRDMVVSFAHMIATAPDGRKANQTEIIADLITGQQKHYVSWACEIQEAYPLLWELGLYDYYSLYLPWMQEKNFMLVRFEDLVGPSGGGSVETQINTVKAIARHMRHTITQEKLTDVMKNLFGGTWTFREGKSAGWKKHFTPEIKALFQKDKRLMQLLVDLGYEKNFSW
jgi:hypothetical protein